MNASQIRLKLVLDAIGQPLKLDTFDDHFMGWPTQRRRSSLHRTMRSRRTRSSRLPVSRGCDGSERASRAALHHVDLQRPVDHAARHPIACSGNTVAPPVRGNAGDAGAARIDSCSWRSSAARVREPVYLHSQPDALQTAEPTQRVMRPTDQYGCPGHSRSGHHRSQCRRSGCLCAVPIFAERSEHCGPILDVCGVLDLPGPDRLLAA